MENKLHHLEMIQGVIDRMAKCSFLLKGWSVVIISALFALSAKDTDSRFIIVAYFPAFIFWILDAFYLWQERLFRILYDEVRIKNEDNIDFSMKTNTESEEAGDWYKVMFSKTILTFHVCIISVITLVWIYKAVKQS